MSVPCVEVAMSVPVCKLQCLSHVCKLQCLYRVCKLQCLYRVCKLQCLSQVCKLQCLFQVCKLQCLSHVWKLKHCPSRPVNDELVCWLVGWLLNVPATCECISGTDLIRQFYVQPHWDRSCRPNFPSHPVTVYWHRADQSQRWPYHARRLAG